MGGIKLKDVAEEKDLGIIISIDLKSGNNALQPLKRLTKC